MTDREAVARAICIAYGEKPDDEGPAVGYVWQLFTDEADAAIACLRERWTNEVAQKRAARAFHTVPEPWPLAALTAAMRDE